MYASPLHDTRVLYVTMNSQINGVPATHNNIDQSVFIAQNAYNRDDSPKKIDLIVGGTFIVIYIYY